MCGIAGIVTRNECDNLLASAKSLVESLSHRGPDDNDVWIYQDKLALVHTRLSIQDLSPNGRQPMSSPSGRYVIVYNGEIYNFKRIKIELEKLDFHFKGGSDTEVILAAIEAYGFPQAIDKFEGMFSFALFDKKDKLLTLCRDRLGEKPLFYSWNNDQFVWASELKALKILPNWTAKLNEGVIPSYLKYGYVPAPYTIYEDCYKLEAGTYLSLPFEDIFDRPDFSPLSSSSARIKPTTFWSICDVVNGGFANANKNHDASASSSSQFNYQNSVDNLDHLLQQVVADQMISDVPHGAFLSGGIDSSLVTSIAQSLSNKPINTFTIGFSEKDYNEAEFAKEIAKHLATNHHEVYISSTDCLELVPKLMSIMDEPFADSSALPAYFVSAMAKEKVTVCLSGDGGDELFCGYNRYSQTQKIWSKVKGVPMPLRSLVANILMLFPPRFFDRIYKLLRFFLNDKTSNSRIGLKVQKLAMLLKLRTIDEVYEMLISYCNDSKLVVNEHTADGHLQNNPALLNNPILAPLLSSQLANNGSFIDKAMAIDSLTYLPDDNLTKVDRTSMQSSLETRLPLLNHKVFEFAWQLPLSAKTSDNQSKRILRDVLYKRVPRQLIERPKMGFSVPIADWLRGPLKDWCESLLLAPENLQHGYLDTASLTKIWQTHKSSERDNSACLWSILMFQCWHVENFS